MALLISSQELVPCVLLSFDDEQILMWRGQNWKPMYPEVPSVSIPAEVDITNGSDDSGIVLENRMEVATLHLPNYLLKTSKFYCRLQ